FPASPGMPIFPVSPERVAGTKPPYNGQTASSPSLPDLRSSPVRRFHHRRNDSDISVQGLAAMFENLEVKDFKEAQARYQNSLEKQQAKHTAIVKDLERKHAQALGRHEVRIEELSNELKKAREALNDTVSKEAYNKQREYAREEIAKAQRHSEEQRQARKHEKLVPANKHLEEKYEQYKADYRKANTQALQLSRRYGDLHSELLKKERELAAQQTRAEQQEAQAKQYKDEVYTLEVNLSATENNMREELMAMEEKLKAIEQERDALKASLKEEEVARIAAEGRIPLPITTADEHDEFASPPPSPRKPRTNEQGDDKENVAPKKSSVDLRMLQKELAAEKRLRERAEAQIDFMKMECQFQCCSCRIADLKGTSYVHDDSCANEMERIKSTIPLPTPPPSCNGDHMEDVVKEVPVTDHSVSRPITPPVKQAPVQAEEAVIEFSPTTGTFKAIPSPEKAKPERTSTPEPASTAQASLPEPKLDSSPWAPAVESTVIRATVSPPPFRAISRQTEAKAVHDFSIHEDAVEDEEENETPAGYEPQTPLHNAPGPALHPSTYFTRTITTTTTIPIHFSPMTPHTKGTNNPLTPSTIAHMPTNSSSNPLQDLRLNALPFDREAALEQIRQRRGRARSMAAGQATPGKQMLEGVGPRRDISAPVSKMRQ
ncbi:hypothetical protein GQ43DRAFT_363586, partial [Delitschia confertaspora ATCC 74209]